MYTDDMNMKTEYSEPARNDLSCEIRLGSSSWDDGKKSVKYVWINSDGKIARGGEVPVEALPQMLEFAIRKKYLPADVCNASGTKGMMVSVGKCGRPPRMKTNRSIEQVMDEYRECSPSFSEDKKRMMKNYKKALVEAGMSEEDADEEVDVWSETTWSNDDWRDYYGLDADDEMP